MFTGHKVARLILACQSNTLLFTLTEKQRLVESVSEARRKQSETKEEKITRIQRIQLTWEQLAHKKS